MRQLQFCKKKIFFLFLIVVMNKCTQQNITNHEQLIENISAQEAYDLIQANTDNQNFDIIDIRTPKEFLSEHIHHSINIDYRSDSFNETINELDKKNTYLVYCRSGGRSGNSMKQFRDLKFMNVKNMLGGIIKWKNSGFPIESLK